MHISLNSAHSLCVPLLMAVTGLSKAAVVVYPQARIIVEHVIRDSRCVPRVALACEECEAVCFFTLSSVSVFALELCRSPQAQGGDLSNGSAQVDSDV